MASSKRTPCLRSLVFALTSSHSNQTMHEDYNSIDVTTQLLLLDGMHTQKHFLPKLRQNAKQIPISGAQGSKKRMSSFPGRPTTPSCSTLAYAKGIHRRSSSIGWNTRTAKCRGATANSCSTTFSGGKSAPPRWVLVVVLPTNKQQPIIDKSGQVFPLKSKMQLRCKSI